MITAPAFIVRPRDTDPGLKKVRNQDREREAGEIAILVKGAKSSKLEV